MLPDTLTVDGSIYAINSDFRIGIMFEQLMTDRTLLDHEKALMALNLYYTESIPPNLNEAIEKIKWFYSRGEIGKKEPVKGNKKSKKENKKEESIYSFDYDDEYIYSAFLSQYGIDLQDVTDLHWWKFKALFKSLNDDNLFSKIMGYRAMKISGDMTDNDKKFYKKMKRIYALPDDRTEAEKEADFNDSLSDIF